MMGREREGGGRGEEGGEEVIEEERIVSSLSSQYTYQVNGAEHFRLMHSLQPELERL